MIKINLLPPELRRDGSVLAEQGRRRGWFLLLFLLLWGLGFVAAWVEGEIAACRAKVAAQKAVSRRLAPAVQESRLLQEEQKKLTKRWQAMAEFENGREILTLLKNIRFYVPQEVWLEGLRVEGNEVMLEGKALDLLGAARLMVALQSFPALEGVKLEETTLGEAETGTVAGFRLKAGMARRK